VKEGQVLGYLDVRVGPQERLDLVTKLNEARAKQRGAEEHLTLAQEKVERFERAGSGISRAELDSAQTLLTEAKTQLATAQVGVKEWQDALDAIDRQGDGKDRRWRQTLYAPAPGDLTDLPARPGTAVEAGGLLARLIDFRLALARLEVPPEALAGAPPAEVELVGSGAVPPALEGASNRPEPGAAPPTLKARLLGPAPQVEAGSQFAAYWYEADTAPRDGVWRPGLSVKALVKAAGAKPAPAVSVPSTSLLYHQGRALVYVRLSPGRYERREVQVLGRDGERWLLAPGEVQAGEPVVSKRAQVLLSEEFRGEADND
jgi:multidrug efflux pump subunit AcrA (membrane-fusion protein)